MRILFVVAYALTPIRTRPYHLLRVLAQRGHQITLYTVWESELERQALENLVSQTGVNLIAFPLSRRRKAANLARAVLSKMPLQARYSWHPRLAYQLERAVIEHYFDVVHVEHVRAASYGLHLQKVMRLYNISIPIVYDSVDCISLLYKQAAQKTRGLSWRAITRFELPRTQSFEAFLVQKFPRVLVTSEKDCVALQELAFRYGNGVNSPSHITVLTNGVDLDYFTPNHRNSVPNTLIYTGKMSYHANVSAAFYLLDEIMPLVWQARPSAEVYIVGSDPPKALSARARMDARVHVTGYVADIRPYLWKCNVAVAPIVYGSGIQNKVLEAMACGLPVVANKNAISALNCKPDREILLAKTPQEFAYKIEQLFDDKYLWETLSCQGRKYIERHHNWERIVEELESKYREV